MRDTCLLFRTIAQFCPKLFPHFFCLHSEFAEAIDTDLVSSNVFIRSVLLTIEFCRQIAEAQALAAYWRLFRRKAEMANKDDAKVTVFKRLIGCHAHQLENRTELLPWRVFHFLDYIPTRELGITNNDSLKEQTEALERIQRQRRSKAGKSDLVEIQKEEGPQRETASLLVDDEKLSYESISTSTCSDSEDDLESKTKQAPTTKTKQQLWFGSPVGLTLPFSSGFSLTSFVPLNGSNIHKSETKLEGIKAAPKMEDEWEDVLDPGLWKEDIQIDSRGFRPIPDPIDLTELPEKVRPLARPMFRRDEVNVDPRCLVKIGLDSIECQDLKPQFEKEKYEMWIHENGRLQDRERLSKERWPERRKTRRLDKEHDCHSCGDNEILGGKWKSRLESLIETRKLSIIMRLICGKRGILTLFILDSCFISFWDLRLSTHITFLSTSSAVPFSSICPNSVCCLNTSLLLLMFALLDDTLVEVLFILKWDFLHAEVRIVQI